MIFVLLVAIKLKFRPKKCVTNFWSKIFYITKFGQFLLFCVLWLIGFNNMWDSIKKVWKFFWSKKFMLQNLVDFKFFLGLFSHNINYAKKLIKQEWKCGIWSIYIYFFFNLVLIYNFSQFIYPQILVFIFNFLFLTLLVFILTNLFTHIIDKILENIQSTK